MVDTILNIVEYIGVISFAISGTVIAINKKTDAVGALFFALLTCFGGGMIRDIALGEVPKIFTVTSSYYLALTCMIVSGICFALAFIPKTANFITKHSHDFAIEFGCLCESGIALSVLHFLSDSFCVSLYSPK